MRQPKTADSDTGVPWQASTCGSLRRASVASELNLNRNFYNLNQNRVRSRPVELGIKFYF